MRKVNCVAVLTLLALNLVGRPARGQNSAALLVVPSKATMLVGETHSFRAVGKDGKMQRNVSWSVEPENAATLTADGDQATLQANEPSSNVVLTAHTSDFSAQATIEIRSGTTLPMGTVKWSVTELPGCKTTKITPAVPSAGGPDIYVQEACPEGTFVRAITEDGQELWRRNLSGPLSVAPGVGAQSEAQPGEHVNMVAHSLCDDVSSGMTKDAVSKLAQDRSLQPEENGNNWVIEEHSFHCKLVFDDAGAVIKKKKTIITD
jgi:hypothetical protein